MGIDSRQIAARPIYITFSLFPFIQIWCLKLELWKIPAEENVNSYWPTFSYVVVGIEKLVGLTGYGSTDSKSDQLSIRKMTARSSTHTVLLTCSLSFSLFFQPLSPFTVRFTAYYERFFPWLQPNGNTRAGRKMRNILLQTMKKWITMTDSDIFLHVLL